MILNTNTIDRLIEWAALPMLAGIACWFAGLAMSGVMLFGLGAMGGSFDDYRTEKGIWMLGALFFTLFGALYAFLIVASVADMIAGRGPVGLLAVDAFIATSTVGFMVRFLWSVTSLNRHLASKGNSSDTVS